MRPGFFLRIPSLQPTNNARRQLPNTIEFCTVPCCCAQVNGGQVSSSSSARSILTQLELAISSLLQRVDATGRGPSRQVSNRLRRRPRRPQSSDATQRVASPACDPVGLESNLQLLSSICSARLHYVIALDSFFASFVLPFIHSFFHSLIHSFIQPFHSSPTPSSQYPTS